MMWPKVASAVYIVVGGLMVIAVIVTVAALKKETYKETTVTGEIVDSFYATTVANGGRSAIVVKTADDKLYYLAAYGEIDEFKVRTTIEVTFSNDYSMNEIISELVENPDGSKSVRKCRRYWWSIQRYRILSSNPD